VSVELASLLLFASMFTLLATGMPIAIALAGVAVAFCIAFWGFDRIYILASAGFSSLQNVNLVAIPLFILMGWIIYKSGIADDLFDTMHVWMGNVKGGLAMGTIVIGALFGAICASLVPALLTITTVALPALLKRGYDKRLALGCIMVSGLLSFLIPPSVLMIIFSSVTGISIGRMYLGALVPGFLLATLYILYIGIRCRFQPELGPPAASETRIGWGVRIAKLKGVAAPLVLLVSMLVGIYSGAVTPMEASAIGAIGAIICAAIKRRLSWPVAREALIKTARITCMVGWLLVAIGAFNAVYSGIGARDLASNIATAVPGGGMPVIIIMQFTMFIFGMIMDDLTIVMIFGPIFTAIVQSMDFDTLWFGVLFMVNIQTALSTAPYGFGLFVTKAAATTIPELKGFNISLMDVIRGALPFIGLQLVCMALILIFPSLVTFLPSLLVR